MLLRIVKRPHTIGDTHNGTRNPTGGGILFSFLKKKRSVAGTVGIAVMPDGVAMAQVERGAPEDLPRLKLCEFHPLEGEATAEQVLKELAASHRLKDADCVSVMDRRDLSVLLVEAPEVEVTELKAAVRWRIKDLLDFHVDDAVIDVFDIPGQQERGRQKMMYVVAARIAAVQDHIDLLENAGINLAAIDIPELVHRNIAELTPEDGNGVAVLALGREQGLLTITRQGSLFLARNLDVGVRQLAAEAGAEPAPQEAGGLSLEQGDELPSRLLRLLDGIVLEVQRSLDYYESHFSLPPASGLVVAPLEEPVSGMMTHLANNLGVPVRMLDLTASFETDLSLPDALQAQCLPAIGAALRQEEKAL